MAIDTQAYCLAVTRATKVTLSDRLNPKSKLTLERGTNSTNRNTRACLNAKFHYAIWSQTGPKLVADLQLAGIWPII